MGPSDSVAVAGSCSDSSRRLQADRGVASLGLSLLRMHLMLAPLRLPEALHRIPAPQLATLTRRHHRMLYARCRCMNGALAIARSEC